MPTVGFLVLCPSLVVAICESCRSLRISLLCYNRLYSFLVTSLHSTPVDCSVALLSSCSPACPGGTVKLARVKVWFSVGLSFFSQPLCKEVLGWGSLLAWLNQGSLVLFLSVWSLILHLSVSNLEDPSMVSLFSAFLLLSLVILVGIWETHGLTCRLEFILVLLSSFFLLL